MKRWLNVGLRWANVVDGAPTVNQRWADVLCLLGYSTFVIENHLRNSPPPPPPKKFFFIKSLRKKTFMLGRGRDIKMVFHGGIILGICQVAGYLYA